MGVRPEGPAGRPRRQRAAPGPRPARRHPAPPARRDRQPPASPGVATARRPVERAEPAQPGHAAHAGHPGRVRQPVGRGPTPEQWSAPLLRGHRQRRRLLDEASYGDLSLTAAAESHGTADDGVVGWLTLPTNHPNTGKNTGAANQRLARDAILAADDYVDFAAYDTDGDGLVNANELHVTVIPAGYEESSDCDGQQRLGSPVGDRRLHAGGRRRLGRRDATRSSARCTAAATTTWPPWGSWPTRSATTSTLPDLYDVDNSSQGGVGYWSVMAFGSWLFAEGELPGDSPPYPDPFSRIYEGWVTPEQVAGTAVTDLGQSATEPDVAQVLDNPNGVDWTHNLNSGTGEYFLVENRQRVGYDRALPGCGVLIWHISEDRPFYESNADDDERLVDLEEADGNAPDYPFDAGDAFLGDKVFDAASTPDSDLYDGSPSGVTASDFDADCADSMSVTLSAAGAPAPANDAFAAATEIEDVPFTSTAVATSNATVEGAEPEPDCATLGKTVWFRFTPAVDTRVVADTVGSSFDTVLAAYEGDALGAVTPVGCSDDVDTPGGHSRLELDLAAGKTSRLPAGRLPERRGSGGVRSGGARAEARRRTGPAVPRQRGDGDGAGRDGGRRRDRRDRGRRRHRRPGRQRQAVRWRRRGPDPGRRRPRRDRGRRRRGHDHVP